MFFSISFSLLIISLVTLMIYDVKNKIEKDKYELQYLINELNKKEYKIYKIYFNTSESSFRNYFVNDKNSQKNIILYPTREGNITIVFYFTKNEITNISDIKINDTIRINATLVKLININEIKDMLNSTPKKIDIERLKEILNYE